MTVAAKSAPPEAAPLKRRSKKEGTEECERLPKKKKKTPPRLAVAKVEEGKGTPRKEEESFSFQELKSAKTETETAASVEASQRTELEDEESGSSSAVVEKPEEEVEFPLQESPTDADPYLLEEAEYLRTEKRWLNKQRTLVVASRGVGARHRHLLEDLKKLLPHHKAESKWERSQKLFQMTELCELRACNNVLFLEQRKRDALLHIAKAPMGPTLICRIVNVHTLQELRLTGNCLLHSRPLLLFGAEFERETPLRLVKELLVQVLGTPRNHPKSKPFFDHVMCFFYQDAKIWFRHYQIEPLVLGQGGDANKPDRQTFTEIGPRFVLEPIKLLEGCFSGKTLWRNADFVATRDLMQPQKLRAALNFARRQDAKEKRKRHVEEVLKNEPKNPLAFEEVFGTENFEKRKK